jgi:hypothetical protein
MSGMEEGDWIEITRAKGVAAKSPKPDCRVRICLFKAGGGPELRQKVYLSFHGAAVAWLKTNGPRFRVQLGADRLNRLRLLPDAAGGYRGAGEKGATLIMALGCVAPWPKEVRAATPAEFKAFADHALITLPPDWATPAKAQRAGAPPPRIIDRRPEGPVSLGDPAPGRSALDQRRSSDAPVVRKAGAHA